MLPPHLFMLTSMSAFQEAVVAYHGMPLLHHTDAKSSLHLYPFICSQDSPRLLQCFCGHQYFSALMLTPYAKCLQRQQLACSDVIYELDSVVFIHSHAIHLDHT